MSGFNNAVVGGSGILKRDAIRNPGYIPGVAGWTINKDGSAEFNNLTIRGSFEGVSWEANASGTFYYAGAPAKNNMIASEAGISGTDRFGNDYLSSSTVYQFISPSLNRWAATSMFGSVRLTYLTPGSDQTGYVITGASETFFNSLWIMKAPAGASIISDLAQVQRNISGLTGEIPLTITDAAPHTLPNTVTPTALSQLYTIPANDMNIGTIYVIEVPLTGVFETQVLHLGMLINGASFDLCPVGTVVITAAGHSVVGTARVYLQCVAAGSINNIQIWIDGVLGDATINRGNVPGEAILVGFNGAISANPAANITVQMSGFWTAAVAGQTLTGNGSSFKRIGH